MILLYPFEDIMTSHEAQNTQTKSTSSSLCNCWCPWQSRDFRRILVRYLLPPECYDSGLANLDANRAVRSPLLGAMLKCSGGAAEAILIPSSVISSATIIGRN